MRCTAMATPACSATPHFLWSGDVYSKWETLKTHIPIAINTGLTGIPYWGTDIGGFVPTKEFTAELYLRWFQFGAFCPLFRCHGRTWKLRLPWGWNTGDPGPMEISRYEGAAIPDASELHNAQVEPICRKYLELRYRLLPYLYSAVREVHSYGHSADARSCGCTIPMIQRRSVAATNISGAETCWSLRLLRREPLHGRSIFRAGRGTTSGRASDRKAAAKSRARSILRPCRCMSAQEQFCRSGP